MLPPASAQTDSPTDSRWAFQTNINGVKQTRCGPLQYYLKNPKNFEYSTDLIGPRREASSKPGAIKDSVSSGRVGKIMGFTIYYVISLLSKLARIEA